jgi:hypothetical protein
MLMKKGRFIYNKLLVSVVTIIFLSIPLPGHCSPLSISAGFLCEYNFYWQPGIRVALSQDNLLGGHPQIMLSYTTSRLSFWNGKNALVIDDILVNAAWHFRPQKLIDPYAGIDGGFIRFNREQDELFELLNNKAGRLNIRTGVRISVLGGLLKPSIDAGYALLTSSTVFPLFISFSVVYAILKGSER